MEVICAAILGLVGIGVTVFFNNKWKLKEYTLNLKKDVYLSAIEAIHHAINSIANLPKLEMSAFSARVEFHRHSPNISKAMLISEVELRKALQSFNQEYDSIVLDLLVIRDPLVLRNQEIVDKKSIVQKRFIQRDNLLEIMKNYNLSLITDQQKWGDVKDQYEFIAQQIDIHEGEIIHLNLLLAEQKVAFLKICMEKIASLREMLIYVEKAARIELELKLDESNEKARLKEEWQKQKNTMDDYISSARQPSSPQ